MIVCARLFVPVVETCQSVGAWRWLRHLKEQLAIGVTGQAIMDAYDRTARLKPLAFLSAPLTFYVAGLTVGFPAWWQRLVGTAALAATGLPLFATQLVGDAGKEAQRGLWSAWGGRPTTLMLRFEGAANRLAVVRRHEVVERVTGIRMPTEQDEAADPLVAGDTYEVVTDEIKELTRGKAFPDIKRENANYGFRRNLYGVRHLGRLVALISFGTACATAWVFRAEPQRFAPDLVAAALCLIWLLLWTVMVTASFVRRGGDRYADRLLGAAATLAATNPGSSASPESPT